MASSEISNGKNVRYVGERLSLTDSSKRVIFCNEVFMSDLGTAAIYRQFLRGEADAGSGIIIILGW